jgi:hypothetical protein
MRRPSIYLRVAAWLLSPGMAAWAGCGILSQMPPLVMRHIAPTVGSAQIGTFRCSIELGGS